MDLEWEPGATGSLRDALEEVGLTLEPGTREVEFLVLEEGAEEGAVSP